MPNLLTKAAARVRSGVRRLTGRRGPPPIGAGVRWIDSSRPGNEIPDFENNIESITKSYYGRVRAALSMGVPGGWASDHYEETLHFSGWNYVAGNAIALQCAGATVEVSRPVDQEDAWTGKSIRKSIPINRNGHHGYRDNDHHGRYDVHEHRTLYTVSKSHEQGETEDRDILPESFPLMRLLNRPNPSQSGAHLRYEISVQLSLTGTALIVKIPNQFGKTVELYCIPTALMTPRPPSSQFPNGAYYVSPAATRTNWSDDSFVTMVGYQKLAGTTIDMKDLIKISLPHPLWKDEGYSPVAAGSLWSDTGEQIDRSRFSQFRHGFDPSVILTPPEGVNPSDNEIQRVMAIFKAEFSGTENTGKAFVTPGGATATAWSTSPKEMSYCEGFDQMRNATMGIHGVPLIAAGITDGGSYAAFFTALKQFRTLTTQPRLDWIAEELTYQLAYQWGEGLLIRLIAPAVDDPAQLEAQLMTDIAAGSIKKGEIRKLRGLPPCEGDDEWAGAKVSERVEAPTPEAAGEAAQALAGGSTGGADDTHTGISTGMPKPPTMKPVAPQGFNGFGGGKNGFNRLQKAAAILWGPETNGNGHDHEGEYP